MRLPALFAIMLVGVIAAFVTASTGAVFTDLATSSANAFTAGTLDLKLNGGDSVTAQYNLTNMAPGDGQVVQTKMTNTGNLSLRYALTMAGSSPSTGALYTNGALTWKVRSVGVAGACAVGSEPEATTTFDFVGGPGASKAISSIGTGATPTITTGSAHGLTTGQQVVLSGSGTTPSIDGRYPVTTGGGTTFTVSPGFTVTSGSSAVGVVTIPVQITGISGSSPTTITTNQVWGLSGAGTMSVTIAGSDSMPSVDGIYTATYVSGTSFTIPGLTLTGSGSHGVVTSDLHITGFSAANPTVVTTGAAHNLAAGDQVLISASTSGTIDGLSTVTNVGSATTFTIAANGGSGGTAGTATRNIVGTPGGVGHYVAVNNSSGASDGKVFGNNLTGQQTTPNGGDRVIDSTATADVLCFKVALPLSTPGTPGATPTAGYQGATGTLNFQFDAEQTKNNP